VQATLQAELAGRSIPMATRMGIVGPDVTSCFHHDGQWLNHLCYRASADVWQGRKNAYQSVEPQKQEKEEVGDRRTEKCPVLDKDSCRGRSSAAQVDKKTIWRMLKAHQRRLYFCSSQDLSNCSKIQRLFNLHKFVR
jgi:hypothetical protein